MADNQIKTPVSDRLLRDENDVVAWGNKEAIPLMREVRTFANERAGRDYSSYRHAGGSGLEAWYVANYPITGGSTSAFPAANTLYAFPFVAPARLSAVDRLAFEVTNLSAGNARMGLWENTADDNLYPADLLTDSGAVSTGTTGVKTFTVDVDLTPGGLYWLSYVASATPTLQGINAFCGSAVLGWASTLGGSDHMGISVAFTYAALPETFPAGAAYITAAAFPALAYRLS